SPRAGEDVDAHRDDERERHLGPDVGDDLVRPEGAADDHVSAAPPSRSRCPPSASRCPPWAKYTSGGDRHIISSMPPRLALVLALATACAGRAAAPASPPYPPARQDNVVETLHGVTIVDPYRWLEDQRSPETRAFIDAQNAYAHALLDPFSGRSRILARLTALSRVDTMSGPFARGGRYFTARRRTNDELTILYVRDGLRGEDRVLVDPHPLSPDRTTSVGFEDFSRDGRRIVYFVRRGGEDESELRVRDVDAGRDLPDVLT